MAASLPEGLGPPLEGNYINMLYLLCSPCGAFMPFIIKCCIIIKLHIQIGCCPGNCHVIHLQYVTRYIITNKVFWQCGDELFQK